MTKTNHPFIVVDSDTRGEHPVIVGTGIRVLDIAIEYEYKGYSIDQIIDYHPHLELKQIHDALSYYYENQEHFDQQIKEDRKRAKEMKKKLMQIRSLKTEPSQHSVHFLTSYFLKNLPICTQHIDKPKPFVHYL